MDLKTIEEALKAIIKPPSITHAEVARIQASSQSSQATTQAVARLETFWTSCDNCGFQYEHARLYLNCILLCANCSVTFMAVKTVKPKASMSFPEAKGSGRFPWAPLDTRAASSFLDLMKVEAETQPKKRKRRTFVKKMLKDFDIFGMLREKGEIYVANKLQLLNQQ